MNTWSNTVLTDKGLSLMAKLTQGNTLNITKAMTGAGFVTPGLLSKQTEVADPKQTLRFKSVTYPEAGKCAIPVALKNEGLTTGYEATQVGLFAEDPDEGEILFLISQATAEGSGTTIPSETEMPGYAAEWTFYLAYGQATGVSVTVDPANAVTRQEMEEHVDTTFKEMKSDINMAGHKITNVAEPTKGSDVATRNFVEQHSLEGNLYVAVDYNNDGNIVLMPYVSDEDTETLRSHLGNKENPHGVTPAQIGAALSGFGYGEVLPTVAGSTEAELETSLTAILNGMASYTTKQVKCQLSFAIDSASYVLATVYKHTPAYAAVTFETVGGSTLKKVYYNGWQPLEWENPPLVNGVEYRTTERYNNKPVYLMRVAKAHSNNVGSSTGTTGLILNHSAEIYRMVRIEGIAHLADDTTVPFDVDSVTKATSNPGLVEGQITITFNGVWSKPTVTVVIAYIKQ